MRSIRDQEPTPFYVPGTTKVEITIPFTGEADAFNIQPTSYTMNPPKADIKGQSLVIEILGTNLQSDQVRPSIDRTIFEKLRTI